MFVIGTAGHVDHGKSSLVRAITGIDPDRLAEEKAREMTIELGFAWFQLPSGREVSVVDVPGHERFIKNMLAGVGGLDAAVLVIAADEGVMPQTVEHLAILDLLGVSRGVVALTKLDLVDDEWLALVSEEVREALAGTALADAPLLPVSSRTRAGLDALLGTLDEVLVDEAARPDVGIPRLHVDRVFTVQGFGTVVTGTLLDGALRVGQSVVVQPRGLHARVRGLQSHKQKHEQVSPGRRVAVNLSGVDFGDIRRGDTVTAPGIAPTVRFDARVRVLAGAPGALEHGKPIEVFAGTAEAAATVVVVGQDDIALGAEGYAQLRTDAPLTLVRGERFILRHPSPSATIGGGVVLDAHPRRHRRLDPLALAGMEALERGDPMDVIAAALERSGPVPPARLAAAVGDAAGAVPSLVASGSLVQAGRQDQAGGVLLFTNGQWRSAVNKLLAVLSAYHGEFPLRQGMPREELKSRLRMDSRTFSAVTQSLAAEHRVNEMGALVSAGGFRVELAGAAAQEADRVMRALTSGGFTPPSSTELEADPEVLAALVTQGRLVRLDETLYYPVSTYTEMVDKILRALDARGSITVAETRDLFGASRKYALALLEHLDREKLTERRGDARVRRSAERETTHAG